MRTKTRDIEGVWSLHHLLPYSPFLSSPPPSGGVLVCSQTTCPTITLNVNCLDSEPKFDDFGKFYCPYCWYKRAVDKCQELREKAMTAKKALSSFVDKNGGSKMKEVVVGDGDNRHDATKGRVKWKLPETAYPHKVAPVKKPLLQEHSTA